MFERYTDRARRVITLSQESARVRAGSEVGCLDLLSGLLEEDHGIAAQVLNSMDIYHIDKDVNDEKTFGHLPFTPGASKALEMALREALALGTNYVGTEHLLLGLVRLNSVDLIDQTLENFFVDNDIDVDEVYGRVIQVLNGNSEPPKETPVPMIPPAGREPAIREVPKRNATYRIVADGVEYEAPDAIGVLTLFDGLRTLRAPES